MIVKIKKNNININFIVKIFIGYFFGFIFSFFLNNFILYYNMKFLCEKFYLMGTHGKIQIFVKDIKHGKCVIRNVIDRIKNIELLLTKFSPDSEIGIINDNPFIYNNISYDTLYVLKIGNKLSFITGGYFDIGLGNILSYSGIDEHVPLVGMSMTLHDFKNELLSIVDNKVKIIRYNSMLDLGGIGKGYALDESIKLFLFNDIRHIAIEFGGDIKVNSGMPSGKSWIIMFDNKLSSLINLKYKFLKLYTGSIAISGGYLKKSKNKNIVNHHIVNPILLNSMNNYFFISVCGAESIICDSLATACYNMDFQSLCKIKSLFLNYCINTYI